MVIHQILITIDLSQYFLQFQKIFKYIIFYQLSDYMSHNALFCHEQFGFRTGHSTELTSLQLTDYLIKPMDQGGT